ncbi:MAG: hypothetical protein ABEJ87_03490 [Candidatus Nanohalobium sp.]
MKDRLDLVDGYNLTEALIAGTIFFLVTGAVTGLIPNPVYIRKVPITLPDYFFLATTTILAALYFGKEKCTVSQQRFAGVGGVLGFLAFGCPICNALLLALFSSSAIMTYFNPLRPLLGIISTLVLALFLYQERN